MGAAGIGIAIFMALSLTISWISGDKARGSLEEKLDDEKSVQQRLEKELKDAKVKAASDGQLLRELESKLTAEIAEKKRLERALDIEEAQKRIAEQEGATQMAVGGDQKEGGGDQKAISELETKNKQEVAMLEARLKAAEDARKQAEQSVAELEDYRARYEKLSRQYAEKGPAAAVVSLEELQRRNKELTTKLKETEEARKSLETKLAGYDNAFTLARASLRNDKLVLDDERLSAKLGSLRRAIDKASASGTIKAGPSEPSLSESVKEAESLLEQARARRAEAEAVLNNSADKDLTLLIKELSTMYVGAKKEKEEALLTVGLLQTTAKQRSKGQVSNLESRLMSLEQNRRGMEGQLTEAMAAIVALDETAARLEAGLGSSAQQSEGMLKLQAEIESLRRARENVKMAMENVKGSLQTNMDSETIRMKSEIDQLSGSLEQIALINKGVGAASLMMGRAGLQEEPLELKGANDASIINKRLQGLNLTIEGVFQEAPTAQVIQPAAQQAAQQAALAEQQAAQAEQQAAQAEQQTAQAEQQTAQTEQQAAQAEQHAAQAKQQAAQAEQRAAQADQRAAQAEQQAAQAEQRAARAEQRAALAAQQATLAAAGASPCAEVREDQQLYESYIVKRGDSLWKIAAEKKIYGNPYLWPILYKYNIETIYNPDIIQQDFALKIKKNPDATEKELAVRKSKRHTKDRRKKGYIKRLRLELTKNSSSR